MISPISQTFGQSPKREPNEQKIERVSFSAGNEEIEFFGTAEQCRTVERAVRASVDHARLMSEMFEQAQLAEFLSFALSTPVPAPEQNVTLEEYAEKIPRIFAQLAIKLFGTPEQRKNVADALKKEADAFDAELEKRESESATDELA